jgi:ParB-like chromosome segregation protein Spo0J
MDIKYYSPDQLKPYEKNPRKNLNVDKVADSLKEFGFQQPIVVDKDMVVIVGHTRLEASKKLGLKEVPVLIADISPAKAKAYRITDNRLNQDSSWDYKLLNFEMGDLMDNHYDLSHLGFDDSEIEKIVAFEPKFESDNNKIENVSVDEIQAPMSQVRMVQLFLNSETEPLFKKMVEKLQQIYGTSNLTDTVYKALENENANSQV